MARDGTGEQVEGLGEHGACLHAGGCVLSYLMGMWDTSNDREFQKEGEQVVLTKKTRMAAENNFQEVPLQTGLFNAKSGVGVCTRWREALGTWDRSWGQGTSLGVVNRQEVKTG